MKLGNLKNVNNKYRTQEKNWNERFILEKIPQYDAYQDINYLSLGLLKSKLRYEEKQMKESQKSQRKPSKLRTNSSRRTFNARPKKNIHIPIISQQKENEKQDLSIKRSKRSNTIKGRKMKLNKTLEYYVKEKIAERKAKKEKEKEREYYNKTYENKYNATTSNQNNIINTNANTNTNSINNNNNEQNLDEDNSDKESIVIDQALQDELNEIKELWENLGVTQEYQIFFGELLDSLKTRKIVENYISYEKMQLIQFKSDLEKLMNDIYKRETDLNNLKKIEEIYSNNEELNKYNILKNQQLKNDNNSNEDIVQKNKEFEEEFTKYKVNKEKIEDDIGNCLKLLRLHTINTVNQFTKFRINYNFYFTSGKNDVNQMKNGYEFDYNYLLKIKKDCEFFKDSSFKDIYNFSKKDSDPFFLNLLENKNSNNKNEYKYLTATEDTINSINQCMFILDQEELYFKISQNQNNNNNGNNEEVSESAPDNNQENTKNSPQSQIGTNFQGNLEKTIIKLKSQNEYENLFFNSSKPKKALTINSYANDDRNSQYEQGPSKIPETTSNELMNSFEYYDKIKKDIFNEEEIQNMHKEIYSTHSSKNSRLHLNSKPKKINNQNQSNNHLIDKFSLKANMNFNSIYKINSDKGKKNPIKINLNKINNNSDSMDNKNDDKNIKIINNKIEKNNDNNNLKDARDKKEDEDKIKIENNNNSNDLDNDNDNQKDNINNDEANNNNNNDDNNNENDNNADANKDNSEVDNNLETISINNEETEEKNAEKCINYKNTSILALVKKKNLSLLNNNPNNINLGSTLFRGVNTFNLNLLLNALKSNNKYSISNYTNSIILSSPDEIKNSFNFIENQNNSISNIKNLQNQLRDKNLIYLSDNKNINYAFLSSLINMDFDPMMSFSTKYNEFNYNGIKINTSKNIISIEDDIILYTLPTSDENILIYVCPYNDKIKEIIKKYDKNNNIFNGFSTFVNLISLYLEENKGDNNENDKTIWVPCFEIDTQLICSRIPGYKKMNIKSNNDNAEVGIYEYNEIVKIIMNPNNSNGLSANIEVNKNEDIIIENDFLFGLYHKEMKNKYNNPFISLFIVSKYNFMKSN